MAQISITTQFGPLAIEEQNGAITRLDWVDVADPDPSDVLLEAAAQLKAYAEGRLQVFDLPTHVAGSGLQQSVCAAMAAIPFGDTRTYGDIAKQVGASAQAVGQACGGNPIPVIIPCHRVMGAGGKLTGFSGAGGVETKVALLRHEGAAGLLI